MREGSNPSPGWVFPVPPSPEFRTGRTPTGQGIEGERSPTIGPFPNLHDYSAALCYSSVDKAFDLSFPAAEVGVRHSCGSVVLAQ